MIYGAKPSHLDAFYTQSPNIYTLLFLRIYTDTNEKCAAQKSWRININSGRPPKFTFHLFTCIFFEGAFVFAYGIYIHPGFCNPSWPPYTRSMASPTRDEGLCLWLFNTHGNIPFVFCLELMKPRVSVNYLRSVY